MMSLVTSRITSRDDVTLPEQCRVTQLVYLYELYVHSISCTDDSGTLTEWEAAQEREEFARAAQMYRPLTTLMASRFTRAQFNDEDKNSEETKAGLQVGIKTSDCISLLLP